MGAYDDILHLPHHVSPTRPRMSAADRAAQFSPFAALTGYEGVLQETARLTDRRVEPDEDEQVLLNEKLLLIGETLDIRPTVSITYFVPDCRKDGGRYVTKRGTVRRLDPIRRMVLMEDGTTIPIPDIIDIQIQTPAVSSHF